MTILEFKKQLDEAYQKCPTDIIRVDWTGEWSKIPSVAVSSPDKAVLIVMGGDAEIKDMTLSALRDIVNNLIEVFPEYKVGLDFHGMICTCRDIETIEGVPHILSGHFVKVWRAGGSFKFPGTIVYDEKGLT